MRKAMRGETHQKRQKNHSLFTIRGDVYRDRSKARFIWKGTIRKAKPAQKAKRPRSKEEGRRNARNRKQKLRNSRLYSKGYGAERHGEGSVTAYQRGNPGSQKSIRGTGWEKKIPTISNLGGVAKQLASFGQPPRNARTNKAPLPEEKTASGTTFVQIFEKTQEAKGGAKRKKSKKMKGKRPSTLAKRRGNRTN